MTVVGAGIAGICAAVAAARRGLKVSLVHDRPVPGGNASSEIGVPIMGSAAEGNSLSVYAREGGLVEELKLKLRARGGFAGNSAMLDSVLFEFIYAEKNIELFLNTHVYEMDCDGIDFCDVDTANTSYFRFCDMPRGEIYDMDYAMYSDRGVLMTGCNKIASYVKAYHNKEWDGLHSYFYTPPEKMTDYAAVVFSNDESVCHICFSAFNAYAKSVAYHTKALVKMCVERLYVMPIIKTEGIPSTARVSLSKGEGFDLVHVKVTYPEPRCGMDIIEEHQTLKKGSCVFVRGKYNEAFLLPNKEKAALSYKDGYTKILLPEIIRYALVYIAGDK